ncbi:MAG: hypothetical protein IJU52_02845 [Clostridia bacterium]|nr:hypothetical protein [Clostridia bacterium]
MKYMKRILSALLVAAFVFGILPVVSFAEAPIYSIDLNGYTSPYAGRDKTEIAASITVPENARYTFEALLWIESGTSSTNFTKFEAGKTYYAIFALKPKAGNVFDLSELQIISVNGNTSFLEVRDARVGSDGTINCYSQEITPLPSKPLETAEIVGYHRPAVGETRTENPRNISVPAGAHYSLSAKFWVRCASDQPDFALFSSGETYYLILSFDAKDGYCFDRYAPPRVLINGSDAAVDGSKTRAVSSGSLNVYSIPLTPLEGVRIDSVTVSGYEKPVVGQSSGDNLLTLSVTGASHCSIITSAWRNLSNESAYVEAFEKGAYYYLFIGLQPDAGYAFDDYDLPTVLIGGSEALTDYDRLSTDAYGRLMICSAIVPSVELIGEANVPFFHAPIVGETVEQNLPAYGPLGLHYSIGAMFWYNDTDSSPMQSTDVFESGRQYFFRCVLSPSYGYAFASDCVFSLGGKAEDVIGTFPYKEDSYQLFSTLFYASDPNAAVQIGEVAVDGFKTPVAGQRAGENLSSLSVPEGAHYGIGGNTKWWRTSPYEAMGENDVFEEGKTYYVFFEITAENGYCFEVGSKPAFIINGSNDLADGDYTSVKFTDHANFYTVDVAPLSPQIIDEVRLNNFEQPIAGQTASENLEFLTVPAGAGYTIEKALWWKTSSYTAMEDGDEFEGGNTYYLQICLVPDDGYEFGRSPKPTFLLNGSSEYIDASLYTVSSSGKCYIYTVEMAPLALTKITSAGIKGFRTPTIGQTAGENLSSIYIPDSARFTVVRLTWYGPNSVSLNANEVFVEGREYYLSVTVSPKEGYYFDKHTTPTAFINNSDRYVDAPYTGIEGENLRFFSIDLEAEQERVEEVNVIGYRQPEIGQTAAENLSSLTVPAGAHYSISKARWYSYSPAGYMSDTAAFEADKQYYIVVEIVPEDGLIFDTTNRPTVYINGSRTDVGFTNTYTARIDLYGEDVVPRAPRLKGDINDDGYVTIADVTALLDILAGSGVCDPAACDLNGDGSVNISDVTALLDVLAGNTAA